jgi:ubiquinone/menaquinone biosynthesis C-methylase UbiE
MTATTTKWTGWRATLGSRHFDLPARARRAGALLERLPEPLTGDETVLDAGAGSGFLTLAVAERLDRGRVIAVELSPDMLARLEQRVEETGLADRVQPVQADAAATGLADASVDLIVSHALLHELFAADAAIAEWARLLKPGGTLLLSDVADGWYSFIVRWLHDRRANGPFAIDTLAGLLVRVGLEDVEVIRDGKMLRASARKPLA